MSAGDGEAAAGEVRLPAGDARPLVLRRGGVAARLSSVKLLGGLALGRVGVVGLLADSAVGDETTAARRGGSIALV